MTFQHFLPLHTIRKKPKVARPNSLTRYSWSLIIGLIVVVAASLAAWFFSPKGQNLTYVLESRPHPASIKY